MPEKESTVEKEVSWRIRNRWLFDEDDEPSVGPDGPDEKDRVLVDIWGCLCIERMITSGSPLILLSTLCRPRADTFVL